MVAPVVRYFWQKPVQCSARQILYSAQWSLERGDTIAAGCKLREAIRSYLHAECEYAACLPKTNKRRALRQHAPRPLANALKKAGILEKGVYGWVVEIIDLGNRAAHLALVPRQQIATAIGLVHAFLDDSPYLVEVKGGRV